MCGIAIHAQYASWYFLVYRTIVSVTCITCSWMKRVIPDVAQRWESFICLHRTDIGRCGVMGSAQFWCILSKFFLTNSAVGLVHVQENILCCSWSETDLVGMYPFKPGAVDSIFRLWI